MGDLFVVSIGYALYGTGFHGALRPSGLAACGLIRRLHKSDTFVLAVDLPSGINTDTGEVAEGAAHADLTVTFDSYKPLHMAEASAPLCGKSSVLTLASGMNGTRSFDEGLPLRKIPGNKNAPGGLVAALRGHLMCVVPWRTRPAFYSIAIRFGFSGKAFVC